MSPASPWIAIVGPGKALTHELELAEEAGAALAAAGAILVCGGLGGVMEAACRGARSRRGLTVGLLPGDDRTAANGWVELAIPTGLGEARNVLVVRSADAVVAIGGGWGTLSEIALACRLAKPVVGIRSWRPVRPDGRPVEEIAVAADGPEAVEEALRRVGRRPLER